MKLRKVIAALAAALSLSAFSACSSAQTAPSTQPAKNEQTFTILSAKQADSADFEEDDFDKLTELREAISKFSAKLTSSLDEDSFIFSPFSAYQALAAVSLGAEGDTLTEFEKAFYPEGWTREDFIKYNRILLNSLTEETGSMPASVNNMALISNDYTASEDFVQAISDALNSTTAQADFSSDEAAEQINKWVKENTNGMIDPLLSQPLPDDTAAAIINTVYFLGKWECEFDEKDNTSGSFAGTKGDQETTYMNQSGITAYYCETDNLQALTLKYTNGAHMTIYLPKSGVKPSDIFKDSSLTENLDFAEGNGSLKLPKFEMESSLDLESASKAVGLGSMFQGGLGAAIQEDEDLRVSSIFQKAKINVDEKGTEAAAATIVVESRGAMVEPVPFEFNVDRPFAYTIDYYGVTLFSGVVNNL